MYESNYDARWEELKKSIKRRKFIKGIILDTFFFLMFVVFMVYLFN